MARLLIDVLYHYRAEQKYQLHEFVVMPSHVHALLSVGSELSIERAVQLIKGGFSYRAARELEYKHDLWQRGFSEHRILSSEQFIARKLYIRENPVRAGFANTPEEYPYCSAFSGSQLDGSPFAGAKAPVTVAAGAGTTKVVP